MNFAENGKEKFLFLYQNEFTTLSASQRKGLEDLLGFLEADEQITDYRHAAYMLATCKHETADTYLPIHERGSREYFISRYGSQTKTGKSLGNDTPDEGSIYSGVGYVQVTGENNAEMLERILPKEYPAVVARWEARNGKKFDLTAGDQPDDSGDFQRLMEPELAYCAMSVGMRKGLFTGVSLSTYIKGNHCDYRFARKIINGLDCADRISGFAEQFDRILKECVAL